MTTAAQFPRSDGLVRGLIYARAGRRPYVRLPTVAEAKLLMTLTAGAARVGFVLLSMEGDDGMELLVATRGAETIRFENRKQVSAWLNHLHACGALGQPEVRSHGPA